MAVSYNQLPFHLVAFTWSGLHHLARRDWDGSLGVALWAAGMRPYLPERDPKQELLMWGCFIMVLQWVYEDSEFGAHARVP